MRISARSIWYGMPHRWSIDHFLSLSLSCIQRLPLPIWSWTIIPTIVITRTVNPCFSIFSYRKVRVRTTQHKLLYTWCYLVVPLLHRSLRVPPGCILYIRNILRAHRYKLVSGNCRSKLFCKLYEWFSGKKERRSLLDRIRDGHVYVRVDASGCDALGASWCSYFLSPMLLSEW